MEYLFKLINSAHKIELDLRKNELSYCCQAVGTARFAYNWALSNWEKQYQEFKDGKRDKKPNEASLRKDFNAIKKEKFPWISQISKIVPQQAIKNLGKAYKAFFDKRSAYPTFQKKYKRDSFYIDNENFKISPCGKMIKIPKIKEWIKMKEAFRFQHLNPKLISATISRTADKWFVSIAVELEDLIKTRRENQTSVGIDLGISAFATYFDGEKAIKIDGRKSHKFYLRQVKLLNRQLSKKVRGSNNYKKAKLKLSKLHMRIANIRNDFIHKVTTDIINKYDIIGIETLNVRGMTKNHCLARSVLDQGFFEFSRQLTYKAERNGNFLFKADRWFPSSKNCSACGVKTDSLPLSVRSWTCTCGAVHDRDENASKNLEYEAVKQHRLYLLEKKALV